MKKESKIDIRSASSEIHTTEDLARYIGSLHEDYQHKLSAVAEQVLGLHEKVDGMKHTQDSHTEMIGELKIEMTVVKEDISEMKNDVSQLKTDMTDVKSDVSLLKDDMSQVMSDTKEVRNLLEEKADKKTLSFELTKKHSYI